MVSPGSSRVRSGLVSTRSPETSRLYCEASPPESPPRAPSAGVTVPSVVYMTSIAHPTGPYST